MAKQYNFTNSAKDISAVSGFKLNLPASVEVHKSGSGSFKEDTIISFINHAGTIIELKNNVEPGTILRLSIALPSTLDSGNELTLIIRGTVVDVERPPEKEGLFKVAVKFESKYIIKQADK